MKVISRVYGIKEYVTRARREGKLIGFVPTMGWLHGGHLSLLRSAREECDVVIMSIFVNPTQFGPSEDLEKYPRDMERDKKLAEDAGADVLFAPSTGEMYPDGYATYVEVVGPLSQTMCGGARPGHFRGVATVVAKLFNIVEPDKSYFGQKDAQQAVIVKRMVKDLDMPLEVRVLPTVREEDGLAMSSRNSYLSEDQRRQATGLFKSLKRAEEMARGGEVSAQSIKEEMKRILLEGKSVRIDYIAIVDADSLEALDEVRDNTLIAVAAFVGGTRLIDNTIIHHR